MRRRPSKGSKHQPAAPQMQANPCRALVPVDGQAIRKKIKRDYERVLRNLEAARAALQQFETIDLPQYQRWFNGCFGALLTEIRELTAKIAANESLIFQVESDVMFGGKTYAEAYHRIMELRENPTPPESPGRDGSPDPFDAETPFDDSDFEDADDPFDGPSSGEWGGSRAKEERRRPPSGEPLHGSPTTPAAPRLKYLYRQLVRRLHPDSQKNMTPQKTEWWHQAQAAYTSGDANQLEIILTLCDIDEHGPTVHTSASMLQKITLQLKSSLRHLKRQLLERRKDPAWNFSRTAQREPLQDRIRHGMMLDLTELREYWARTQAIIAIWKEAAERRKKPRKPMPQQRAREMDLPF